MSTSEKTPFQLTAGHPALDFINTLDNRFVPSGPEELLTSYDEFLRFVTETGLLSAEQAKHLRTHTSREAAHRTLESARNERELLAKLFYDVADGRHPELGSINRILQMILPHRRIKQMGENIAWTWEGLASEPESPLWLLAFAAAELLTSPQIARVRTCGTSTCKWLFLDSSKSQNRRWCNMRVCGNRTKARRYYHKDSAGRSSAQDSATEG